MEAVVKVDTVKGAAAGALGVWAMDVVTWSVYRRLSPATLAREKDARAFGKDPAHAAAEHIARALGVEVKSEPNALGIAPAVAYASARRRWRRSGLVVALCTEALPFIANDEVGGRVLGLMVRSGSTGGRHMPAAS